MSSCLICIMSPASGTLKVHSHFTSGYKLIIGTKLVECLRLGGLFLLAIANDTSLTTPSHWSAQIFVLRKIGVERGSSLAVIATKRTRMDVCE